jgi:predicted transcriptional regulator
MKQVNVKDLTRLETILLNEIVTSNMDQEFVCHIIDSSEIDNKSIKGVISSLVKKGIVTIQDYEGKGLSIDNILYLNDNSKDIQIVLNNFNKTPKLFNIYLKGLK